MYSFVYIWYILYMFVYQTMYDLATALRMLILSSWRPLHDRFVTIFRLQHFSFFFRPARVRALACFFLHTQTSLFPLKIIKLSKSYLPTSSWPLFIHMSSSRPPADFLRDFFCNCPGERKFLCESALQKRLICPPLWKFAEVSYLVVDLCIILLPFVGASLYSVFS